MKRDPDWYPKVTGANAVQQIYPQCNVKLTAFVTDFRAPTDWQLLAFAEKYTEDCQVAIEIHKWVNYREWSAANNYGREEAINVIRQIMKEKCR